MVRRVFRSVIRFRLSWSTKDGPLRRELIAKGVRLEHAFYLAIAVEDTELIQHTSIVAIPRKWHLNEKVPQEWQNRIVCLSTLLPLYFPLADTRLTIPCSFNIEQRLSLSSNQSLRISRFVPFRQLAVQWKLQSFRRWSGLEKRLLRSPSLVLAWRNRRNPTPPTVRPARS